MKSRNINYLPAVDHVRAYAALLIIFYHGLHVIGESLLPKAAAPFQNWPHAHDPFFAVIAEGHTAVAMFIVLSGFIFTFGVYGEEISYWKFIRNRVLRIYPLFLVLLFVGAYSFPDKFTFSYFLQTLFALSNVQRGTPFMPFSGMFWTIAVEMQFYLFFPFLLSILNRRGTKSLIGLIAVAIALRWFSFMNGATIRDLVHFTIVGRIDQFLLGMMAAVIYRKYFKPGLVWDITFVISLALAIWAAFLFNQTGGWPAEASWKIILPTIEGLLWALVILGYFSVVRFFPDVLSRSLAAVGTISYSLYLLHLIVIYTGIRANWFWQLPGCSSHQSAMILTALFVLPIVIAFATLTYLFIEKPFLEMRGSYKKKIETVPFPAVHKKGDGCEPQPSPKSLPRSVS